MEFSMGDNETSLQSRWKILDVNKRIHHLVLTHCGPATPYGNIDLSQKLAQVLACCLMAPSHYLNQFYPIISEVLRHSPESNFTGNASDIHAWYEFENYYIKITVASPRGSELIQNIYRLSPQVCTWFHFCYILWTVLSGLMWCI